MRLTGWLFAFIFAGGAAIAWAQLPGVSKFSAPIATAPDVEALPLPPNVSDPDAGPVAPPLATPAPATVPTAKPKKPLIPAKMLFGAVKSPASA